MNTLPTANQGESSGNGTLSVFPAKRRRGRPRKNEGTNRVPPGFQHETHHPPHQITDGTGGTVSMVGQAVSGFIEATFDDGYVITVRVANSPISFRGAVFKQGNFVPVTPETDVAPHVPVIRSANSHLTIGPSQAISAQATAMVPAKRKRELPQTPKTAPSTFPVGVRGTVVPVVLKPVNLQNGFSPKSTDSFKPGMITFGDQAVHSAEALAALPHNKGSEPINKKQPKEDASEIVNIKPVESTDADETSGASDTQTDSSKEALKPQVLKQESGDANNPSSTMFFANNCVPKATFNFSTGKMTQLLQAVQDQWVQSGEFLAG